MVTGLAYSNKNGDFADNIPYIIDVCDIEEKDEIIREILNSGGLNITPFHYHGSGHLQTPEMITWDFVKKHRIKREAPAHFLR